MTFAEKSLKQCLQDIENELVTVIKGMANSTRFHILVLLLGDQMSFHQLLKQCNLKKTALANHLNHLIKVKLVEKKGYGIYSIKSDGVKFLRANFETWEDSIMNNQKKLRKIETRSMSKQFVNNFLHK